MTVETTLTRETRSWRIEKFDQPTPTWKLLPCTIGNWGKAEGGGLRHENCEEPAAYMVRYMRLLRGSRWVPSSVRPCERHAREIATRRGLYMPGEEPPAQTVVADGAAREGDANGVTPRAPSAHESATAFCVECFPAWGAYAAGEKHVPAPGGCAHGCGCGS